nr:MAG TPA: hypothetical protein [Crassvirales sp.]
MKLTREFIVKVYNLSLGFCYLHYFSTFALK